MHQMEGHRDSGDGLTNGQGTETSKVTFLPEQQTKVQELIDEAYKRAYSKAIRSKGGSEEVEKLKTEVERLKQEKKTSALLRAVARHNVVDAEEVADLLRERVRIEEDGMLSVLGDGGSVRINNSGMPMSVDEFVSGWLGDRPHHLRTSGATGAGSSGARFSASRQRYNLSDPSVWRTMPREDLDNLLKDGISVQGAAGQTYSFRDVKNPFIEARRKKFQSGATVNG